MNSKSRSGIEQQLTQCLYHLVQAKAYLPIQYTNTRNRIEKTIERTLDHIEMERSKETNRAIEKWIDRQNLLNRENK